MRKRYRLMLWLSLLVGSPLAAQDVAEETVDQYQVEVLVFRHLDQARNTEEIARLVEPEIDDVLDQQLARLSGGKSPADDVVLFGDSRNRARLWRLAGRKNLLMQADANRLRNLQAYELISHIAWVQPAEDVAVAEPIAAADLASNAPLSGTLKLYRKRYLHLAVDLILDAAINAGSNNGFNQFLPVKQASPAIVDSRRMRLGRTVYFDHPQFGVLATVNKLESN